MRRRWTTPSFSVGRSSHVPGRFSWRGLDRVGGGPQHALRPVAQIRQEARQRTGGLAGGFGDAGAFAFRSGRRRITDGRRGAGDAQEQCRRDEHPGGAHARRRNGPVAAVVERRQHPAFELLRTRHADGHRRHAMIAEGVGNLEQMTRVFTGLRARRDHAVVARELPFDPQPPRDPPHGRMEPVQGTGHECQRLGQAIATGDVRELVQDDRAPAIAAPRVGNRGNQDRRPPDAERHRHRLLAASKQADLASHAHGARALGEQAAPLRVPDVARAARAPAHARALHEQRDQDDRDASRVHRADQRRPGEVEPARAGRRSVRIDGDRRRRARAGHELVSPIDDRGGIGGLRRGANREGPARQGDRCHREQRARPRGRDSRSDGAWPPTCAGARAQPHSRLRPAAAKP